MAVSTVKRANWKFSLSDVKEFKAVCNEVGVDIECVDDVGILAESVSVTNLGNTVDYYIFEPEVPFITTALRLYITKGTVDGFGGQARVFEIEVEGNYAGSQIISDIGSNRATGYNSNSLIVHLNGQGLNRTYFSWLDEPDSSNTQTNVMINYFDHNLQKFGNNTVLGYGVDNHGSASLALDKNGRMHAVYGAHDYMGPLRYRYTPNPENPDGWSSESVIEYGTYPSVAADKFDSEKLHMVFREAFGNPDKLVYWQREAFGSGFRWRQKTELAETDRTDCWYTSYGASIALDSMGRLHLAFHILGENNMSEEFSDCAVYMRSDDGGITWVDAAGQVLSVPVNPNSSSTVYRRTGAHVRVGGLTTDNSDNPWFLVFCNDDASGRLYGYDGNSWRCFLLSTLLANELGAVKFSLDGVLSVTAEGELWALVSCYNAANSSGWGSPGNEVVLLRVMATELVEKGYSANRKIYRISKSDPSNAAWLPSIERKTGPNLISKPAMMYTRGNWDAINTNVYFVLPEKVAAWPLTCQQVHELGYAVADVTGDCMVNFYDLAIFLQHWREEN